MATMAIRPLLKWAGGKARMAGVIDEVFGPCTGTYYEPFLGAGAVFLRRAGNGSIQAAHLNDINSRVMGFHQAVCRHPEQVIQEMRRLPVGEGWEASFEALRHQMNFAVDADSPLGAALFLWVNRAGFNGLYRENKRGECNVPVGRYDVVDLPGPEHLRVVSQLLGTARLTSCDFEQVIDLAEAGDHVYCDPPYIPISATAAFTTYTAGGFTYQSHVRLAAAGERAAARGVKVAISSSSSPLADLAYERYAREPLAARRSISCQGRGRGDEKELLCFLGM